MNEQGRRAMSHPTPSGAPRLHYAWVIALVTFVVMLITSGVRATPGLFMVPLETEFGWSRAVIFDILGTTASGWLTDRWSARHLLFAYYTLRGVSLLFLPATLHDSGAGLGAFAVFYGLDWVATVPPTVKLTTEAFGRENTGVIYGWIGASHQLGASMAAFGAGAIRTGLGDYRVAFLAAGLLCLVAGASFLIGGRVDPDEGALSPRARRAASA